MQEKGGDEGCKGSDTKEQKKGNERDLSEMRNKGIFLPQSEVRCK